MAKKSEMQRAIDEITAEFTMLERTRGILMAVQRKKNPVKATPPVTVLGTSKPPRVRPDFQAVDEARHGSAQ